MMALGKDPGSFLVEKWVMCCLTTFWITICTNYEELSNEVLCEILSQGASEIQEVKLLAIQVYLIK